MTIFYFVLFLISFVYLFLLLFRFGQSASVYYYLLSVCIILINFGYWQESIAATLEAAMTASRVSYLGSAFVCYFMVCSIAQLTKTKLPPAVHCIGTGMGILILLLAMTIGYSGIYYKSAQLMHSNGFSYIVNEYGPMHAIFVGEIILWLLFGIVIVLIAFTKGKKVSYISCIGSLAVMASVAVVYFIRGSVCSMLPLAYDAGFAVILFLLLRISLYNPIGLSEQFIKDSLEYGFISFDSKGHFLDGNSIARKWFPEINDLKIDRLIPSCHTDFLKQVHDWIDGHDDEAVHFFHFGEQIIEAKKIILPIRKKKTMLFIQLRDDTKQQKYLEHIENKNFDLKHDIAFKTHKIEQLREDIIIGMASIVENRDSNTGGHIRRTSDIVRVFAEHLMENGSLPELTEHAVDCIIRSAPLHDFGKIAIPDAILNKPGKYTPEEFEEMKKHPVQGAAIVDRILQNCEDTQLKSIACNIAHYHHEKWDGSGYPDGLKGEEIPVEARIMALADVFDALVSKRVYKEQFSFEKAFSIIRESSGSHFDPFLCEQFAACRDSLIAIYSTDQDLL
ncbi:MAG: HD domain-containing protein [Eubacteriales bacterium]|nr:HD domain-containing protein [Eubacteriales bacterium]